ncbi:beta-lactamase/transpeptidase-like protein [Cercophora newfieldiana]|uniref:Beta-lactamase/transpeptidase-like protein n=1 Tax=Cercophora newfieldiana TaxID=92897 RepID=A0AA40CHL3_9PEZI|nr:beta-lactamase/transpeptidase-like protein [Cercophora newfieldiana]
MSEAVDKAFAAAVREKRVPGIATVALNRDGSVIYKNSWGTVNINDPTSAPVTSTTKMEIASMLKAFISVAALQLLEQGKFSLDDLVEEYIPSWTNISVLDGFTPDGEPILRPPKTKATILQLFTHTAGPGYWFTSENLNRFERWAGTLPQVAPDPVDPEPLIADPGTGWFYGTSNDYLGHIVETISGVSLTTYLNQHIFTPLGIQKPTVIPTEMHAHRRLPNGTITSQPPNATNILPSYLLSSLDEYAAFLLALINHGTHPTLGTTILQPSTVKNYVFTDLFPLSLTSPEPYTGPTIGWSAAFLVNNQDVKGRRSKGSGAWGGIYNLYYWVDLEAGKLGLVFTNLLPFLDPVVLDLFGKLEEFVYGCDE